MPNVGPLVIPRERSAEIDSDATHRRLHDIQDRLYLVHGELKAIKDSGAIPAHVTSGNAAAYATRLDEMLTSAAAIIAKIELIDGYSS